jgi:mannose-1-phosphate guanylyltransferase
MREITDEAMGICNNIKYGIIKRNSEQYKENIDDPEVQKIFLEDPVGNFKFVECDNYFWQNGLTKFDLEYALDKFNTPFDYKNFT